MIKISYMMLVFNAIRTLPKGMLEKNLRRIHDQAHEIFIIEGASRSDMLKYTKDGRSTDGTIELINNLKKELPKIRLIQKEGFWDGKNEMCKSIAGKVTGDYIFQLDSDEFYHEDEFPLLLQILEDRKPFAVHFYAYHFFGDFDNCIDKNSGGSWVNSTELSWGRIFKNLPGKSMWIEHRPPTYLYNDNIICNNQPNILTSLDTFNMGIHMYHYSYVTREQASFKKTFYRRDYEDLWDRWQKDHSIPLIWEGHTVPFNYERHPIAIKELINENKL